MKGIIVLNLAAAAVNFIAWQWGSHSDVSLFCCGISLGVGFAFFLEALRGAGA